MSKMGLGQKMQIYSGNTPAIGLHPDRFRRRSLGFSCQQQQQQDE